jgi:hypothetical protein
MPYRTLVLLESPYAGDVDTHVAYARRAMAHSLSLGEAPLASHLLYTQPGILDDTDPAQRTIGIAAGLSWGPAAAATDVYRDYGVSDGMALGIRRAEGEGRPVIHRFIGINTHPRETP